MPGPVGIRSVRGVSVAGWAACYAEDVNVRLHEVSALFEESVELFEQLGDEHWALQALRRVGRVYEHAGDLTPIVDYMKAHAR